MPRKQQIPRRFSDDRLKEFFNKLLKDFKNYLAHDTRFTLSG